MSTIFCPKCNTNVLGAREEIDWFLVIILAIFTAGIALIVYLIVYYGKPENHCIHCHSIGQPPVFEQENRQDIQNPYHNTPQVQLNPPEKKIAEERPIFCQNCGVKLERESSKFCALCGNKIQ